MLGRRSGGGTRRRRSARAGAATLAGCAAIVVGVASPLHAGEPSVGVSGEGCPPGETVVLTQEGVTVGTDLADDNGRFATDLDENPGGGPTTLTVSCGAVEMTLSLRTGAASNPPWGIAGVAVALVLFTTSAIVVVRRRAERERRLEIS